MSSTKTQKDILLEILEVLTTLATKLDKLIELGSKPIISNPHLPAPSPSDIVRNFMGG